LLVVIMGGVVAVFLNIDENIQKLLKTSSDNKKTM